MAEHHNSKSFLCKYFIYKGFGSGLFYWCTEVDRRAGGIFGTVASIVAALLILYVLIHIYNKGLDSVFSTPTMYVMAGLIVSGVFALIGYWHYTLEAKWRMRNLSPIALTIGALGVVLGYLYGPMLGGSLIVLAYVIELFVGIRLYEDFKSTSPTGARLFLIGVVVFMVFLPVILVAQEAALVSAIGDIVKIAGLLVVLRVLME